VSGGLTKVRRSTAQVAVCAHENKIYAFGGCYGHPFVLLNTCEVYDTTTNTWERLPDMAEVRSAPAACQVDGKIYVCGGHDNHTYLTSCEVLDTRTRTWSRAATMQTLRGAHSSVAYDGRVFACGGKSAAVELLTERTG